MWELHGLFQGRGGGAGGGVTSCFCPSQDVLQCEILISQVSCLGVACPGLHQHVYFETVLDIQVKVVQGDKNKSQPCGVQCEPVGVSLEVIQLLQSWKWMRSHSG